MSNHKSVARNQGYTRGAVSHIEKHNERKNTNYSNIDVVLEQSHFNIHFKKCEDTYLSTFDKMVQNGEISTRGLKLNSDGTKPESSIIAEMVFDVNTEYFETEYKIHGYTSGYDFAKAFYAEAYKMAVTEVGDEKYILSATMHADERNKALSEQLCKDVYHYHLHVVYIPVVQKEILYSKRIKDKSLVGKVKEVINQVNHSKKWESEKEVDENGKEYIVYSYSKLQDRYHDFMKSAGFNGFERGKLGSTAQHLSVLEYKTEKRKEELAEKEITLQDKNAKLELANVELEETQSELENVRSDKNLLAQEKEKLEKEVEPIRELQKLKTKIYEIKMPDKPLFGSNVKISYEELLKQREMAAAYIANEKEIKDIRKRRVDVSKREQAATEKDKNLTAREKILDGKEDLLKNAIRVKMERDNLQKQSTALINENNSLKAKLQEAYSAITKIIQAIGLLKYDFNYSPDYKIENLSPKQATMIDALAYYGARLAEKNNFPEQADAMIKNIALDVEVKNEMRRLSPNIFGKQQKSYDYDYER